MTSSTDLVPPGRLGVLLRRSRVASGREPAELAAAAGVSVAELDDLERGRHPLDPALLERLVSAYGIDGGGLVPSRTGLVIDLEDGRIAAARSEVSLEVGAEPDAVLVRYLALVYRLRDLPVGTALDFRDVDLDVLARALTLDTREIDHRLRRLVDEGADISRDQRRLGRQFLVPLAGVVVAATTAGALVLVAVSGSEPSPPPVERVATAVAPEIGDAAIEVGATPQRDVPTEIGPGGAVERNPTLGDAAPPGPEPGS